jgi:hypothetical protein
MQNIAFLQKLKGKYRLNDWGFYQLIKTAAGSIYEESNDQKLFIWYILLKTGYRAKLGYNDTRIYLLLATENKIYNVPYFIETGESYYLVDHDKSKIEGLKTHEFNYPGSTKAVSLLLDAYPLLQGDLTTRSIAYKGAEVNFEFDSKVLDFLSSYPHHQLSSYFMPGISTRNVTLLDLVLKPHMNGLEKREIIDLLLDFSQKFTSYATDQDQFGRERYLFAEESLFYPSNDCEDRTILLASLVERYTGLKSIALDFPGHVNLAVNIPGETIGNFINFRGERFLICDPTYINAKSGMLAQQYKSERVKIITF